MILLDEILAYIPVTHFLLKNKIVWDLYFSFRRMGENFEKGGKF